MKKKVCARVLLAIILVTAMSFNTYATPTTESNGGTTEAPSISDKDSITNKKNEAQDILDALESDRSDLQSYVTELDGQLAGIETEITSLSVRQTELEAEIDIKQTELAEAKAEEERQYNAMKERIKYIYENGDMDYVEVILAAESMADVINSSEYISQMTNYDQNMLDALAETRASIADAELVLQNDLASVDELKTEQEEKQTTVNTLIEAKNGEIAAFDSSISIQSDVVAQYEAQLKAIEDQIAAQAAALAASQAAANGGTQVTYSGGALLWPCPSSYRITSGFGAREAPTAGASTYHKGIDIGVASGSPIIAVADGTVKIAQYSSSAGNYIMIDHGGLVTVYMHNSSLAVSVGQQVKAGQVIAYSGSTGYSTGPHLHFGVIVNGQYVNPMSYVSG